MITYEIDGSRGVLRVAYSGSVAIPDLLCHWAADLPNILLDPASPVIFEFADSVTVSAVEEICSVDLLAALRECVRESAGSKWAFVAGSAATKAALKSCVRELGSLPLEIRWFECHWQAQEWLGETLC